MSVSEKLSFRAHATAPDLRLQVRFDGREIFSQELTVDPVDIVHEFDDSQYSTHLLEIEMSGKTRRHTRLNESGEIIEDRVIVIKDIAIGNIALTSFIISKHMIYDHDTNGTEQMRSHEFFDTMGCNGVVRFSFTTPVYLWLLENL